MKSIIKILIVSFLISSCLPSNYRKELIGEWEYVGKKYTPIKLIFNQDSLFVYSIAGKSRQTWKADKFKIYLYNTKFDDSVFHENLTYEYELSEQKDSLTIKALNTSPIQITEFVKSRK